jgi:hypothetical protein
MSKIIPLDQLQGTMPRIGKLSAGYMESKTVNGRVVTYPAKSRTLVFRSSSPEILRAAAQIVRGTVSKSPNPRAEGSVWRLVSEATDLEVLIASDDRRDAPARYEAWGASGKIRECDGHTCRFMIDPKTGERRENVPCWCVAQGLQAEDGDACRITTRLNLFVPAFVDIPGIGVWQLESRGRTTYQDLKGLRDLFQRMRLPGAMGAPVTLRIEIVRRRNPGSGDPQEFPVFRFQSKLSLNDTLARAREFAATVEPAKLPPTDDSTPPLGAVLDCEQEALAAATPVVDTRATLPGSDAEQTSPALPGKQAPKVDLVGDLQQPGDAAPKTPTTQSSVTPGNTVRSAPSTFNRWTNAGSAPDEPEQLTPEDARQLRIIIEKTAVAEGYEGKGASRKWVVARYGFNNGRLEDVPRALRARMRADAFAILSRRKQTKDSSGAPGATPPSADGVATTGNGGDVAPAGNPSATSPTSDPAVGAQPATAEQLNEIRRQCTLRGIVHPEHDPGIRQSARRDIDRLEDLTQGQADRVIRYLKYITNEMIPDVAKRLGGTVVEVRSRRDGPAA